MQAIVRTQQFPIRHGQFSKVAFVLAVVAAITLVSAVMYRALNPHTASVPATSSAAMVHARTQRLMEINVLPESSEMSLTTRRMLDINQLPAAAPLPSAQRSHFLELNTVLPDALTSPDRVRSTHLFEINILPSDQPHMVLPSGERGARY
jgi:hypothetical protein